MRLKTRCGETVGDTVVNSPGEEVGGELLTCEEVEDYDAITHHLLACIHTNLVLEMDCTSEDEKEKEGQDSELDWFRHADQFCQSQEEFKEKQTAQVEAFNEIGQQALQECHADPWIVTDILPNPNSRLYTQSREEIRQQSVRQRHAEKARLRALMPTSKKKLKRKKRGRKKDKRRKRTRQEKVRTKRNWNWNWNRKKKVRTTNLRSRKKNHSRWQFPLTYKNAPKGKS